MYTPARAAVTAVLLLLPAQAAAQAFGIGPRMSFVKSGPPAGDAGDRYSGAALRVKLSPRSSIELAMDRRSTLNADATLRVTDSPLQGSLMVYPMRGAIAPYVLGGAGLYAQRTEAMAGGKALSQQTLKRTGYHGGFGGELQLGRRATVFADYRYTFIHFGDDDAGSASAPAGLSIPGAGSLLDNFRMSHEGSMWTTGLTINF